MLMDHFFHLTLDKQRDIHPSVNKKLVHVYMCEGYDTICELLTHLKIKKFGLILTYSASGLVKDLLNNYATEWDWSSADILLFTLFFNPVL